MDLMQYKNRPDYTTEMRLHDGTVEIIKHCGMCLAVIPRSVCEHCNGSADSRRKAELAKLQGGAD